MHDATITGYQAGERTLIDVLLAEQTLTDDTLALVDERQRLFSALARLRFEAGELVRFDDPAAADAVRFDPAPFVQQ